MFRLVSRRSMELVGVCCTLIALTAGCQPDPEQMSPADMQMSQPASVDGSLFVGPAMFPSGPIGAPGVLVSVPIKVTTLSDEESFSVQPFVTPGTLSIVALDENDRETDHVVLPRTTAPDISTRTLKLRISIPSGVAGPASVSLKLTSMRNDKLTGVLSSVVVTIGQTAPLDTFAFKLLGISAGSYDPPPANIIHAPVPGPTKVRFLADLSSARGDKRYSITLVVEGSGWSAETDTPTFTLAGTGAIPFQVWLHPTAGASEARLTVRITNADLTQQSTQQFDLRP